MPSLLTYLRAHANLGDYIQSLAARQFLPSVDRLICRDKLSSYRGPPTKLILNGWLTHHPHNWAPSAAITPLLISVHLNPAAAPVLLSGANLEFFRRHAPVGCRDHATLRRFEQLGIPAYFSGCLTLTLRRPDNLPRSSEILLVDVPHPLPPSLSRLLAPRLLADPPPRRPARLPATPSWFRLAPDWLRFRAAEARLRRLAAARLVITTRLHTALPCLAMGTPAILLRADHSEAQSSRFDGLLDLLPTLTLSPSGSLSANFPLPASAPLDPSVLPPPPPSFSSLASSLRSRVLSFLSSP